MDVIDVFEPMPEAAPSAPAAPRHCRLQFTGTGAEYFRIWIVNLLLTIVTLGVYSAWAKVRKLQYFYRNTSLDGSVFGYHGNPLAILKGRLLAVFLLGIYKLALTSFGAYAAVAVLALMAVFPWLMTQSYRFRLRNSSYRGLRFRFDGPAWQLYVIFGLPMLLLLLPGVLGVMLVGLQGNPARVNPRAFIYLALVYPFLLLSVPYLHYRIKRWQHAHARYGTARAAFTARAWDFYAAYLGGTLILLLMSAAVGVLTAVLGASLSGGGAFTAPGSKSLSAWMIIVTGLFYAVGLSVFSYVNAMIQNAVWSGTQFDGLRFESDLSPFRMMGLTLSNIAMIVCSLGLLTPFAMVRLMKAKVEAVQVLDAQALSGFAGDGQGAAVAATGEGALDVMDLDFGL